MTDNSGNIGKSAEDNGGKQIATPNANTNPYSLSTSAPTNLRRTTSLTITASATDREQSTLSYALYFNGSYKQTVSGAKGNTVTFTAISGLSEATHYSWYVNVSDGAGGSARLNGSAYTNCSGVSIACIPTEVCTKCGVSRLYVFKMRCGADRVS